MILDNCKICKASSLQVFAHTAKCDSCGVLLYFPYPEDDNTLVLSGKGKNWPVGASLKGYSRSSFFNHNNFTYMLRFAIDESYKERKLKILDYGGGGGQDHFDGDDMPNLDEIGQEAFNEAMDGGADVADAGQAAADAIQEAATEAGMPPEVVEAGLQAAGDAFRGALENGSSPQEAFDAAMDAGGSAADGVMMDAGFEMGPEGLMPPGGPEGPGPNLVLKSVLAQKV